MSETREITMPPFYRRGRDYDAKSGDQTGKFGVRCIFSRHSGGWAVGYSGAICEL